MHGSVLVVEDDSDVAEVVAALFRSYWPVHVAHNAWQAQHALSEIETLCLALVDLDIPGPRAFDADPPGGGFEVITAVRRSFPSAVVVVVTAHLDARIVNRTQRLGAELIVKENYAENLAALIERMRHASISEHIEIHARELQRKHSLTERQVEVVVLALRGFRNVEIAEELSISINTLKAHSREILRACAVDHLSDLARRFWRR